MNSYPDNIEKYLKKHGVPEIPDPFTGQKFDLVFTIPVYDELSYIGNMIKSLEKNTAESIKRTLIIFCVNNSPNDSYEIKSNNFKTIRFLNDFKKNSKLNLLILDFASAGKELNEKDAGVGLARKTAMDISLKFFDYDKINQGLIFCTDADCIISENAFATILDFYDRIHPEAGHAEFAHPLNLDDPNLPAIIIYEIFLRYYVLGLTFSHSKYAFHTIGSTMFCTPGAYVKSEGMNKRKAAEDFYFLEKLSKNYEISIIKEPLIFPSSRESLRVPFGTGKRVTRYNLKVQNEYLLYNPESFEILKKWHSYYYSLDQFEVKAVCKEVLKISPVLLKFFESIKFFDKLAMLFRNSKTTNQLERQKKNLMDAFLTLKLMHYLRDNGFPELDSFEAVKILTGKCGINTQSLVQGKKLNIEEQTGYLKLLRNYFWQK